MVQALTITKDTAMNHSMFPKLPNDPDFDRNFDRNFDQMGRNIKRAGAAMAVWGVISTLLSLGLLGLLIYVAHHFIAKVW